MKIISEEQPIIFRATGRLKTSIESYVKALIEVVILLGCGVMLVWKSK